MIRLPGLQYLHEGVSIHTPAPPPGWLLLGEQAPPPPRPVLLSTTLLPNGTQVWHVFAQPERIPDDIWRQHLQALDLVLRPLERYVLLVRLLRPFLAIGLSISAGLSALSTDEQRMPWLISTLIFLASVLMKETRQRLVRAVIRWQLQKLLRESPG